MNKHMTRGEKLTRAFRLAAAAVILLTLSYLGPSHAFAAVITTASDTLSTIKESVGANHTVQFTLNGSDTFSASENITVVFPTGFDLTSLASPGDFDFRNASTDETLRSAACAGGEDEIRVTISSQTVTFAACSGYTAESAGSTIVIKIGTNATVGASGTHQITNQTAAQNNTNPKITIGGTDASGTIAVEIVSDNTVAVTATVDPSITCSIDTNSAAFGTFTLATVTTAGSTPTWTISTNALNGYSLGIHDLGNGSGTAGLYSAAPNFTIASATADLASAASGYGLQGTKTNGDAGSAATTISSPFTATGTNVGALVTTAIPGSGTTLATASGPVSNATVVSTLKAKVSGLVPPGSYLDTLTYVCTGIF